MKNYLFSLLSMLLSASAGFTQIPNNGFESWTNMGSYSNPDNWSTLNNMTAPLGVYTCTKGTPGNPGTAYIKLTSKSVTGMGVVPGIAICGTLDSLTMQPLGGFPFTNRPANLTGSWQHMIFGSSQGYIDVVMTYWDAGAQTRMPVASAHYVLTGMAMSWANFTIPITYVSNNSPDSCMIVLSASGSSPSANDYLWVDNLNFSGTVSGIAETLTLSALQISPNPAHDFLTLDLTRITAQQLTVDIYAVSGKMLIRKTELVSGEKNILDISELPSGSYLLKLSTETNELTRTFIKK